MNLNKYIQDNKVHTIYRGKKLQYIGEKNKKIKIYFEINLDIDVIIKFIFNGKKLKLNLK